MAAGAPVIALKEGGATESVTEKTGIFFYPQTVEALKEAVLKLETGSVRIEEAHCRQRASEFTRERFKKQLSESILNIWTSKHKNKEDLLKVMEV
jgi:glycosyltransferase involved in cell wall biosynthesis